MSRKKAPFKDYEGSKQNDKLSNSARDLGLMMNSVEAIEEYLDERYDKIPHYSKYVGEFINEYPKRDLSSNNARSYNCNKQWNFI